MTPTRAAAPPDLAGLFDRHARELVRYCTRRVGAQLAEDVVAETFLVAHERRERFDPERGEWLPWLYGIATNLLRRHRRAEIRALRRFPRWAPIAAAAAVLLVVGAGIVALRPRTVAGPEPFSSDPARVHRVFDELIAAGRTATPYRPRAGQLLYFRETTIEPSLWDGQLYERSKATWIEPGQMLYLSSEDPDHPRPPGKPGKAWAEESAKYPKPPGPDTRPFLKLTTLVAGPTDPAAARQALIDLLPNDDGLPPDGQVWANIYQLANADALIPVDRRIALYRVLADLPVSVAETSVGDRRLIVMRFNGDAGLYALGVGDDAVVDLLFDPATGRFAGDRVSWKGSPQPRPLVTALVGGSSFDPRVLGRPVAPGSLGPGVYQRDLWSYGLVEEIGERP